MLGTDTGFAVTPYGEWHARELELLMKYGGLSALEAISAGTYNGGFVLNLDNEVGAVEPGMLADLLVVDGDPSSDITILQDHARIREVILDGKLVSRDEPVESWPNEAAQLFGTTYLTRELTLKNGGASSNGAANGQDATLDRELELGAPND